MFLSPPPSNRRRPTPRRCGTRTPQNLLRCENEKWDRLDASPEMLRFCRDWEEKKTEYRAGTSIRLRMGEVLEFMKMDVSKFEATVNKGTSRPRQVMKRRIANSKSTNFGGGSLCYARLFAHEEDSGVSLNYACCHSITSCFLRVFFGRRRMISELQTVLGCLHMFDGMFLL